MILAITLAGLLIAGGTGVAPQDNTYYVCSYEVFEDGRPLIRRIEYFASSLAAARAAFEAFLRDLETQGRHPRSLGCR